MGMDNKIQKYNYSIKNKFSEGSFFKDILTKFYNEKLLDDSILSRIYYERMDLLKVKLKYYTKDESSSVMVELAESILQCIDYTLGVYLKTFNSLDLIIEELKSRSLFDMLKIGHDLIKKKTLESKKLLYKVNESKLKVNNYSYNDTIEYGIPLFFKEYDDFFSAHEGSGSIDYQLHIDNMNYIGIEYIFNYLSTLSIENEFCNNFHINEINELLKGYDKKCEVLLINIFELVLINSIGRIICGKDLNSLNINKLDRDQIKNKLEDLSLNELEEELLKYVTICYETLNIKDEQVIEYIKKSTVKITSLINNSLELNTLEKVFISFNEKDRSEIFQYIDGEKMPDSEFKKLSEEIRECASVDDKVTLIKNNIKSLEDLVDILNADCLFEDEYIVCFKNLSQMEIVLLSKHICEIGFDNEYEKQWHCEFNKYILSLMEEEQIAIREAREKIEL